MTEPSAGAVVKTGDLSGIFDFAHRATVGPEHTGRYLQWSRSR